MPKRATLTIELEPELRDALVAEAEAIDRPPARVVHDLINDFVHRRRDAREYDAWFRAEVEQALREADDPTVERISNEVIRASWREQRAELLRQIAEERGED
jgi:predicted transcriptional regulator